MIGMILALMLAQQTTTQPVLVCGEYQHVQHWMGQCGPPPPECGYTFCTTICAPIPPDKCVDDVHLLSEREWQDLIKRLNKLEAK